MWWKSMFKTSLWNFLQTSFSGVISFCKFRLRFPSRLSNLSSWHSQTHLLLRHFDANGMKLKNYFLERQLEQTWNTRVSGLFTCCSSNRLKYSQERSFLNGVQEKVFSCWKISHWNWSRQRESSISSSCDFVLCSEKKPNFFY